MVRRVLLADDDADDRLLFEEVFSGLSPDKFKLFAVVNGEEVLRFLREIKEKEFLPDLIILDQNMPLMSGKDALIAIKNSSLYQHIPVIIYSTYNEKTFIEECTRLGVSAVVSKPDSYEGYIKMINIFLRYTAKPVT